MQRPGKIVYFGKLSQPGRLRRLFLDGKKVKGGCQWRIGKMFAEGQSAGPSQLA
jgi:hypothetical protein